MRLEKNKDGSYNVWMQRDEYHQYHRSIDDWEKEIAIRLMGDCGLRIGEAATVRPCDIKRYSDGKHWKLHVRNAKDTTGEYSGGGKERETWLPRELETEINRYAQERDIGAEEHLIPVKKRQLGYWVEDCNEVMAERTENSDWLKVSSHDFRRTWAHYLLVEKRVNPRIVMELGGWESYDSIEPYLNKPTESNIIDSMTEVGL